MRAFPFAFAMCVPIGLALSGCGGDGSRTSADDIRALTGLAPPIETAEEQRARLPGIGSRADSLIVSTIHGETDAPELPTYRLGSLCSGSRCTITGPATGFSDSLTLSDVVYEPGPVEAVGTRHGVTLMSQEGGTQGAEFTAFGAWMEHGGFAVYTTADTVETPTGELRVRARYGIAGGDLTGTAPTGSATWLGLMVGTPATGSRRGDRLQGDAALNLDLDHGYRDVPLLLDVAFSSIKNIDRGAAHSTETVVFPSVPIDPGGTFEAGLAGNRIQGGFYGPEHVEAAGVFEQSNIVGAFGARKQ